jgi:hypothetical protein
LKPYKFQNFKKNQCIKVYYETLQSQHSFTES